MKYKTVFTKQDVLISLFCVVFLLMALGAVGSSGREHAKMLVCRANLGRMVSAASLWSQDHDDWCCAASWSWNDQPAQFVHKSGTQYWMSNPSSLAPYSGTHRLKVGEGRGIYVCPSAKDSGWLDTNGWTGSHEFRLGTGFKGTKWENEKMYNHCTYAMNGWLCMYDMARNGVTPGDNAVRGTSSPWFGPDERFYNVYAGNNPNGTTARYEMTASYMNLHGTTRINHVRKPAESVYFMDSEYYLIEPQSFDPFRGPEDLPVENVSRWHMKQEGARYGKANIGWIDGHVSIEPNDMDNPALVLPGPDGTPNHEPRWTYYFWNN